MVWSRDGDAERPPLSVILPRLYLGAESDVTQEQLASLGISYVLSVSRCSPQPSFLPSSRFLRIPIDDSLWDDLLPWIPQALHFIDAAMSSGASVLVHCAAGISRSPALAVAYIMYSLEMDLDHAYRFVKERRPTISPNFNFLGQLQHFQGALSQKTSGGDPFSRQLSSRQDAGPEAIAVDLSHHKDPTQQRHSPSNGGNKAQTLHLTLCPKQKPCEVPAPSPSEPPNPAPKPTHMQLPSGSASLLDKRKSLTLSLTPVVTSPPSTTSCTTPKPVHSLDCDTKTRSSTEDSHRDQNPSYSRCSRTRAKDPGLLSPFSITLSKLLDWGEKVLLAGAFVHPVKMGRPALPYRC
ncbi:dual specificity protein phosphatase 16 [Melanotaenia boesemani]|uniref:dual specificity protein phosphatase 16 n=1 Tax=Melanotaenia boesemani TaxID=1250792 RepID=UPI001C03D67E|nr:dual specificity protein phosphatase 16 [Melanotaenia boesemani]